MHIVWILSQWSTADQWKHGLQLDLGCYVYKHCISATTSFTGWKFNGNNFSPKTCIEEAYQFLLTLIIIILCRKDMGHSDALKGIVGGLAASAVAIG